jgi:hypothetical protein
MMFIYFSRALLHAFKDYDTTVGNGLVIGGEHFDVHRLVFALAQSAFLSISYLLN